MSDTNDTLQKRLRPLYQEYFRHQGDDEDRYYMKQIDILISQDRVERDIDSRESELTTLIPQLNVETECVCCTDNEDLLNDRLAELKKQRKEASNE